MNPHPDETPATDSARVSDPDLLGEREWMRRLALSLTGDDHGAADLEQDTWVKLLRNPPDRKVSLRAWIATVMRNTARNAHRGRSRRAAREELWSRGQPTLEEGLNGLESDVAEALRRAVDRLGEPYHETISLRFYRQLTPKQIGEHLGIPAATVRTRLRRALQQLRQDLDGEHGGERAQWVPSLAVWALGSGREELTSAGAGGALAAGQLVLLYGVVPLLLIVGGLWWWLPERSPEPAGTARVEAPRPERAAPRDVGLVEPQAPVVDRLVPDVPGASQASVAAEAAEPGFAVHVLDEAGQGVADAVVRLLPPDEPGLLHEGAPEFGGVPVWIPITALEQAQIRPRSGTVRVAVLAPGRRSVELVLEYGRSADLRVTLEPSASLEVIAHVTHMEELGLRARSGGATLQEFRRVPDENGMVRAVWEDLKPGPSTVEVLCTCALPVSVIPDEDPNPKRHGKPVNLVAGQRERLEFTVDAEHVPRRGRGRLGGTILVDDRHADEVSLELHAPAAGRLHWMLGHDGLPPAVELTPGPLRDDGRRQLDWVVSEPLVQGTYEVMLMPFGALESVEVPAEGEARVVHDLPAIRSTEVQVVSGVDGRVLADVPVVWRPAWDLGPFRDDQPVQPLQTDAQGRLELLGVQGPGQLIAHRMDDPGTGAGWHGELTLDGPVDDGAHLTLRVWPLTAVEVRLVNSVGEPARLRLVDTRLSLTAVSVVEGVALRDAFLIDESSTYRRVLLGVPGSYRVGLRSRGGRDPGEPVLVELVSGQPQVVELLFDPTR